MAAKTKAKKKIDYKAAATKLGSCVLWALKFMNAPGGGIMYDPETAKMRSWQTDFMDALDMIGYKLDREAYFASREKKRKRS